MTFHEVQFPTSISRGSAGGPERLTDVVTLRSGHEERNTIWANSRHRYDASMGLRSLDDLHDVIEFFEARSGRLHAFRWKDWVDYKSGRPKGATSFLDQVIGTGDGSTTTFQLRKTYSSGSVNYLRDITKPVDGTVSVAVAGTEDNTVTIDHTTGLVTFSSAPSLGQSITAGFEFDVPCRFDSDYLAISVDAFEAGALPSIDVLEVRI